jgi:nitrite reductase/ring-hydroxylating ferredoxin subunit/thioredoxin reductase
MNDNAKPDFKAGVPAGQIPDGGMLPGAVGDEDVLLIRRGTELFAVGAYCTHYHGPLAQGLIVGDTVRCPLHHACFSLRTGEALRAPALDPIDCWRVEQVDGKVMVRDKLAAAAPRTGLPGGATAAPDSVVIVGGGAAGLAAADSLRRYGYGGAVTLLSADESPPIDRPNLSKDFLAGTAPPEWIPLRTPEFYTQRKIDLIVGARVAAIDTKRQFVELAGGRRFDFDALLLATGAEPVRLDIPGAADSQICYLRTFADAKVILAKAAAARRVVVIGASFIGLEVAAALRTRDIEVHVVGPEEVPMARVLGEEAGRFIQGLHESRGVRFHLGTAVDTVAGKRVALADGTHLDADFLIVGVGVRPSVALAEQAGLALDRGVSVNEYLETSAPGCIRRGRHCALAGSPHR